MLVLRVARKQSIRTDLFLYEHQSTKVVHSSLHNITGLNFESVCLGVDLVCARNRANNWQINSIITQKAFNRESGARCSNFLGDLGKDGEQRALICRKVFYKISIDRRSSCSGKHFLICTCRNCRAWKIRRRKLQITQTFTGCFVFAYNSYRLKSSL